MKLTIDLRVKFRAFGITFGTVTRHWEQVIPLLPGLPTGTLFSHSDAGVTLIVALAKLTEV